MAAAPSATKAGVLTRSSGGVPAMENAGVTTRSAPSRAPSARAARILAALSRSAPMCGLIWASAMRSVSGMVRGS